MIPISFIKMSMRNLLNSRLITAINIIGLTIGISVSLLIFSFVRKEITTDRFIPGVENIYMLSNGDSYNISFKMVNELRGILPEIETVAFSQYDPSPQIYLAVDDNSFLVERLLATDSCFFQVFPFKTIAGDPIKALNMPNRIVLTKSLAKKIFGEANPIGKTVIYNATYLQGEILEIGGVIEDIPHNSSWNFEAVLSYQTYFRIERYVNNLNHWGAQNYSVFLRLNKEAHPDSVQVKLASIPLNNVPEHYRNELSLNMISFCNVYFDVSRSFFRNGDRLTVSIINISGLLILLLVYINYINIVTAQRERRLKNLGISKTLGSSRYDIIRQFVSESLLVIIISIIISFILIGFLLNFFNALTHSEFTFYGIISPPNLWILLLIILLTIVITGIIPGYIYGRYKTIDTLNCITGRGSSFFRSGLLICQFIITIALISGILLIHRQYRYISEYSTGFSRKNVIYLVTNDNLCNGIEAFKNEVSKIPGVQGTAFSEALFGYNKQNWGQQLLINGESKEIWFSKMNVSPNFFEFFGINFREGRAFNENSRENQERIFNATAMVSYNIDKKEDVRIDVGRADGGQIVGIVDDFNFESLHLPVRPICFMCAGNCENIIYLKTNTTDIAAFQSTISDIESVWNEFSPDFPFDYKFYDESWNDLYAKDKQFRSILGGTTILSLILSCLGLVGLTLYVTERRTKEIGIRKVNGAKIWEVMAMLNFNFVKWVFIAFALATPLSWYTMNLWLRNFSYRTELSWWIFALAGLIALAIALLTVSWQSWQAARRNPVEALRYE
jgi:putative ABC transport system permease protein